MKRLFIILVVLICACIGYSQVKVAEVQAKGIGRTRDEAIKKALYQAVSMVKGVNVSTKDYEIEFGSGSMDIDRTEYGKTVEVEAVSLEAKGTSVNTKAKGLVKSYEVIDEKKIDDESYEVNLKVLVYDYENKIVKDKLAVMPIKTNAPSYSFGNYTISGADLSKSLAEKITAGLTQTNKFAILDRAYIDSFFREKSILVSDDASMEEKAKLGNMLGTDYMFVGTISDVRLDLTIERVQAIGAPAREYKATFKFEYRLIDTPTSAVVLADAVDIYLEDDQFKALARKWEPDDIDYRQMLDNLVAKVAGEAVEKVMETLYPIRVANIDEAGQIIIDQGNRRIVEGDIFEVFAQSNDVIDSDTGQSLGKTETFVAKIKITKVMPKFSYAELIEGDKSKLSQEMVCRIKKVEVYEQPNGAKSDIQTTPEGGVILPFDKK